MGQPELNLREALSRLGAIEKLIESSRSGRASHEVLQAARAATSSLESFVRFLFSEVADFVYEEHEVEYPTYAKGHHAKEEIDREPQGENEFSVRPTFLIGNWRSCHHRAVRSLRAERSNPRLLRGCCAPLAMTRFARVAP